MGGYSWPSRWTPPSEEPDREEPTPTEQRLQRDYANLRLDCAELEELLGSPPPDLTDKDLKRLDKAVTVMKVAFKLVAKVLRAHGYDTRKEALAAGSRRAKTPQAVECGASQSGGDSRNAQDTPGEQA